jgi:hypothetical protein
MWPFNGQGATTSVLVDIWWNRLPVLAVKLPRPPSELKITSPYPALQDTWNAAERRWGWFIANLSDVPDVQPPIDVTLPYQPPSGPMPIPDVA